MNPKLLSAGCSFIYGAELSDCLDINGKDNPSSKTWPALYAKSNGLDHFTCSGCGLSNQGIVRYVIDAVESFNFDFVIVQWTFFNRYELRLNNKHINTDQTFYYLLSQWLVNNRSVPAELKELLSVWYRHVDSNATEYYYYLKCQMELANYLRWKNIPFVFADSQNQLEIDTEHKDDSIRILEKFCLDLPKITFNGKGFYNWSLDNKYPIGVEHPLDEAHYAAAELVQDSINKYFKI